MAHLTNLPTLHADNRLRVLAADSTPMSTQLLVEALSRDTQFLMLEAPCTEGALVPLVKREKPHVVLISGKLAENGADSFDSVRSICALRPGPRVVVLLDHSERAAVVEAFRAGARGVFCRTEPFRLLAKCIECVNSGQVWASSDQLHFLIEALAQPTFANFSNDSDCPLSAREADVVRCVAEGLTNRQIAQRLKLTEHTVKNYLFRIFDKLEVSSRVEVVLYALGNGLPHASGPLENRRHSKPVAVNSRSAAMPVPIRKSAT